MLRRALSSSFDESAYGSRSFGRFLANKMGDVVRVVPAPATGGDCGHVLSAAKRRAVKWVAGRNA